MPNYATTLRNAMMDAITTAIDAGVGAGLLRYYDGVKPASCGTATTLIAELTMSDPSAVAAAAGVWSASAVTDDPSANATGDVTWARLVDSTGTCVMDLTAGDVGTEEVVLDNASIVITQVVSLSSLTITEGNA